VKAVETVDQCLERVVKSAERRGATLLITADHGNCELMIDPMTDGPHTAHTTNPVPFLLVTTRRAGRCATAARCAMSAPRCSDCSISNRRRK